MSDYEQEQTQEAQSEPEATPEPEKAKGKGYHVSDLPEGAVPDPLGDASLSAQERATATSDAK